jgi:hypothetical protein
MLPAAAGRQCLHLARLRQLPVGMIMKILPRPLIHSAGTAGPFHRFPGFFQPFKVKVGNVFEWFGTHGGFYPKPEKGFFPNMGTFSYDYSRSLIWKLGRWRIGHSWSFPLPFYDETGNNCFQLFFWP